MPYAKPVSRLRPPLPNDNSVSARDQAFADYALVHLDDVARYAYSLTRDAADADDLVQDTFALAYEHWDQFLPGSEGRAWLFTICRRRFLRVRQRAERQIPTDDAGIEALSAVRVFAAARDAGLDQAFARTEIREAVETAMATLPETFRDVAVLVDMYGQSYEETSEILGIPIGTVRSRLFRARRLLQEQLMAFAEDAGFAVARAPETIA